MAKRKDCKTCIKCGCLAIEVSGGFLANYFQDGICVRCREHDAFGMPDWADERLRLWAMAYRAANRTTALMCFADYCTKPARPWWYVCSTKCRDNLRKSML